MPQKFLERFKRIDELIALKATRNPAQLAFKLDISESTLYEFLKALKDLGHRLSMTMTGVLIFITKRGYLK